MGQNINLIFLKGDENMIEHIKCIDELNCLYWRKESKKGAKKRTKKFAVGDICYLYLTNCKSNRIYYKMEVIDTSTPRNDKKFWKVPFEPDTNSIKLVPISPMYNGCKLRKEDLENIGISRYIQSYKYLNEEQAAYIEHELHAHKL